MSSGLQNCFDEVVSERVLLYASVCVCVCGSNRLAALGAFSYLLKVGISEKLI